jgi:nitrogen regulatory protein PII
MQPPGCVVPLHRDTFFQIKQRYPERTEPKVRANIYLEDWKLGHFIQHGDQVSTHWKAGDGFIWDSEVLHLSANAGMHDKYTMQVSGFLLT